MERSNSGVNGRGAVERSNSGVNGGVVDCGEGVHSDASSESSSTGSTSGLDDSLAAVASSTGSRALATLGGVSIQNILFSCPRAPPG